MKILSISAKLIFKSFVKPVFILCILLFSLNASAQTIRYVSQNGTGNGSSWLNASSNLQLMINSSVAGDQVWVAGGTYKPAYRPDNMSNANPNDRVNTFLLKKDVKIYGGFSGSETTLTNRDLSITANTSHLSGDLYNQINDADNAFHVVVSVNDAGTAELNGFTIRNGNANGSGSVLVDGTFLDHSKAGGIYLSSSSPTLINLIISGNKAINYGGGIYLTGASPVITNVILRGNYGQYGGGIFWTGSFTETANPTLTNVLITGNSSSYGGGIYNGFSIPLPAPILNNVTISGNTGDVEWYTGSSSNNAVIRNSIVYGNGAGNDYMDYKNSIIQYQTSTANGNVVFTGSVTELFVDPANGNYNLKPVSVCVDAGFNGYFPGLNANTKDLAGNSRVYNYGIGGTIDIGAYESSFKNITPTSGIVYVTTTGSGDFSGSNWANATNDIQKAIDGTGVQQVWVAGGTYKPAYRPDNMSSANPNDRENTFLLKKDVKIYGGFAGLETALTNRDLSITANASILSGNLNNQLTDADNAYHVVVSVNDAGTAELNGFTIRNGNANGSGSVLVDGTFLDHSKAGGIYLSSSSPTLINLIISGNKAINYGGGIYLTGASPIITNVILRGNYGQYGGGICWSGTFTETANPTLTNVLITGNSSSYGGGIYNGFSIPLPAPILNNVTISGNTGDVEWYTGSSSNNAVIRNSIVYGNGAGNDYMDYKNSIIQYQTSTANGNVVFTGSVTELFVDPANGNYNLKAGSICVNAGFNGYFPGLNANTKDLAGNARVYNYGSGGTIDIGAYESNFKNITPTDGIVYVTTTGSGDLSGSSWVNATNDIQKGINSTGVQQVWVAGGTYKPRYRADNMSAANSNDRNNAFVLKKDIKVFGGFAGTETKLVQRDSTGVTNTTILNGNLGSIQNFDNAYHVVISSGEVGTAELNGFTINGGNAGGTSENIIISTEIIYSVLGGGLYISTSSPLIKNIIILGNTAIQSGGGIYIRYSSPTLSNVTVKENSSGVPGLSGAGGGIYSLESSNIFTNVLVNGNTANNGGGIFLMEDNTSILTNVTISENNATSGAGLVNNAYYMINNNSIELKNVVIVGNTATSRGGVYNVYGDMNFVNCTVAGNSPTELNGGDMILKNSIVWGNSDANYYSYQNSLVKGSSNTSNGNVDATGFVDTDIFTDPGNGNYTLKAGSPAINTGDNIFFPDLNANTKDLAGNPRVFNFAGGGIIDMGAYESATYFSTYITSQPLNTQTVCLGNSSQNLEIAATGDELTYQWYVQNSRANFNGLPVINGNNNSYTPPTNLAGTYYYYVVVTGLGGEAISEYASVTVKANPITPVVSGTVNVCNYLGTTTGLTYTAQPDEDVLYYTWSVGPKVSIVNGQGTNSIAVRFETDFATSPSSKQIRVIGTTTCGTSDMAIFYLAAQLPQTPGQISGPTEVCSYLGTSNVAIYDIPDVTSASSYMWTVPAGAMIVGNNNGTSINVLYDDTFIGGNISVIAVNSCGASLARSLVIKRTKPSTPGLISGPQNICLYLPSIANPNGLTGVYSVKSYPYLSYVWTVPQGIVIQSQTHSGTVDMITVSFNNNYDGGSISVASVSECGTSAERVLNLAQLTPGSVGGILEESAGNCSDRTYNYSVASMPTNSLSLEWTVPAGATIISGQGTTTITVVYPNEAISGLISAVGNNGCGNSNKPRTFAVKLEACTPPETMVKGVVKANPSKEFATNMLEINLYPNPSLTTFKLNALSTNLNDIMQVRIVDNLGREFKRLQMKSGETISFGSDLKPGSYFVEVSQGKVKSVKKLIKF